MKNDDVNISALKEPYYSNSLVLLVRLLFAGIVYVFTRYSSRYDRELSSLRLSLAQARLNVHLGMSEEEISEWRRKSLGLESKIASQESMKNLANELKECYDNEGYAGDDIAAKKSAELIARSIWPLWFLGRAKRDLISYHSRSKSVPSGAFTPKVVKELAEAAYVQTVDARLFAAKSKRSSAEINKVVQHLRQDILSSAGIKQRGHKLSERVVEDAKNNYIYENEDRLLNLIKARYKRYLCAVKSMLPAKEPWYKAVWTSLVTMWSKLIGFRGFDEKTLQAMQTRLGVSSVAEVDAKLKSISDNDLKIFIDAIFKLNIDSDIELSDFECCRVILSRREISKEKKMLGNLEEQSDFGAGYKMLLSESKGMPVDTDNYWGKQADLRISMAEIMYRGEYYVPAKLCIISAIYLLDEKECVDPENELKRRALLCKRKIEFKSKAVNQGEETSEVQLIDQNFSLEGESWVDRKELMSDLKAIIRGGFNLLAQRWPGISNRSMFSNNFIGEQGKIKVPSNNDHLARRIVAVATTVGSFLGGLAARASGSSDNSQIAVASLTGVAAGGAAAAYARNNKTNAIIKRELTDILESALNCYKAGDYVGFLEELSREYTTENEYGNKLISFSQENITKFKNINNITEYNIYSKEIIRKLLEHDFSPDYIAYVLYLAGSILLHAGLRFNYDSPADVDMGAASHVLCPIADSKELSEKAKSLGGKAVANLAEIQKLALLDVIMVEITSSSRDHFKYVGWYLNKLKEVPKSAGKDEFVDVINLIEDVLFLFGVEGLNTKGNDKNEFCTTISISNKKSMTLPEDFTLDDSLEHQEALESDLSESLLSGFFKLDSNHVFEDETWGELRKERANSISRFCEMKKFMEQDIQLNLAKSTKELQILFAEENEKLHEFRISVNSSDTDVKSFCSQKEVKEEYLVRLREGGVALGQKVLQLLSRAAEKRLYIWYYVPSIKKVFLSYFDRECKSTDRLDVISAEDNSFIDITAHLKVPPSFELFMEQESSPIDPNNSASSNRNEEADPLLANNHENYGAASSIEMSFQACEPMS